MRSTESMRPMAASATSSWASIDLGKANAPAGEPSARGENTGWV
jgi:hypothetical protein